MSEAAEMSLTHRQRVQAVLAGEHPGQPVVDLGGRVASLNKQAHLRPGARSCAALPGRVGAGALHHGPCQFRPVWDPAGKHHRRLRCRSRLHRRVGALLVVVTHPWPVAGWICDIMGYTWDISVGGYEPVGNPICTF